MTRPADSGSSPEPIAVEAVERDGFLPAVEEKPKRGCCLTTVELHRLDNAVGPLVRLGCGPFSDIYLVGTANTSPDFRDVDVRMILSDDRFDALFGHSPLLWGVFCYAVSRWLEADTGLPIDFQVQRQTEANAQHTGMRNPLSGGPRRHFAGLGDATKFERGPEAESGSYQAVVVSDD